MTLDVIELGFISSVVTEVLKLFPIFNKNAFVKSLVAIVVTTGVVFIMGSEFTVEAVVTSLVVALTSYKMIVQPIASEAGLSTQK